MSETQSKRLMAPKPPQLNNTVVSQNKSILGKRKSTDMWVEFNLKELRKRNTVLNESKGASADDAPEVPCELKPLIDAVSIEHKRIMESSLNYELDLLNLRELEKAIHMFKQRKLEIERVFKST